MFESRDPAASGDSAPQDKDTLTSTVSYVTLAQVLKVQQDTLQRWVKSGKIIQPSWFGGMARWTVDQVKLILAEGTQPAGTYPPTNPAHQVAGKQLAKNAGRTKTAKSPTRPLPAKGKLARPNPTFKKGKPE